MKKLVLLSLSLLYAGVNLKAAETEPGEKPVTSISKKEISRKSPLGNFNFIQISSNGKIILISTNTFQTLVWNLEKNWAKIVDGKIARQFAPSINGQISPDNSFFVTETLEKSYVWSSGTGNKLATLQQGIHAIISSDSQFIVTSDIKKVENYIWTRNGKQLATLQGSFPQISPDSSFVVTDTDQETYIWNPSGNKIATLQGTFALQISSDSQLIFTTYENETYIWNTKGDKLAKLQQGRTPRISSNNKFIVTSDEQKIESYLWDIKGNMLATMQGILFTISPDNKFIITGTSKESFIWNTKGNQIATLKGVAAQDMSPQSKLIFTSKNNKTYIWNTKGDKLAKLQGEEPKISSNSQFIVTRESSNIYVWNTAGKKLATLKGTEYEISPDSTYIAYISSADETKLVIRYVVEPGTFKEAPPTPTQAEIKPIVKDNKKVGEIDFNSRDAVSQDTFKEIIQENQEEGIETIIARIPYDKAPDSYFDAYNLLQALFGTDYLDPKKVIEDRNYLRKADILKRRFGVYGIQDAKDPLTNAPIGTKVIEFYSTKNLETPIYYIGNDKDFYLDKKSELIEQFEINKPK